MGLFWGFDPGEQGLGASEAGGSGGLCAFGGESSAAEAAARALECQGLLWPANTEYPKSSQKERCFQFLKGFPYPWHEYVDMVLFGDENNLDLWFGLLKGFFGCSLGTGVSTSGHVWVCS